MISKTKFYSHTTSSDENFLNKLFPLYIQFGGQSNNVPVSKMFVFLSCRTSTKPDIVSVQPVYEETHKNKKQGIVGISQPQNFRHALILTKLRDGYI